LAHCPGVFLVPPFSRAEYALPLVEFIRSRSWHRFPTGRETAEVWEERH